jgi:chromosome partitioning protein
MIQSSFSAIFWQAGVDVKIISLYSIKGGVGKTAAAVNLSYLAAHGGNQALLCDLDPQGASSYYFRIKPSKKYNSEKFLRGKSNIFNYIKQTDFERLDLLPSDFSYRNLDRELSGGKKPLKKLSGNLSELNEDYRFIFLDCPPNLTLLSESVFAASDVVLVPVVPTTLSVRTYLQLLDFFRKEGMDTSRILAFFSMVEQRKTMQRDIIAEYRNDPGFLSPFIPYNSEIEKMGIYRAPVVAVRPGTTASNAYNALWQELRDNCFTGDT